MSSTHFHILRSTIVPSNFTVIPLLFSCCQCCDVIKIVNTISLLHTLVEEDKSSHHKEDVSDFRARFSATRLQIVSIGVDSTFGHISYVYAPVMSQKRSFVLVMASIDGQEPVSEGGDDDELEDEEEKIPLQNIPLESKLQIKLEQKMKMKIAKKIRLRRKRLMRKRRMRKRGRWPPSKMKKLKNV